MTTSRRAFFGVAAGALLAARARARAQTPAGAPRPVMAGPVMVIGGTGKVGSIAVRRLAAARVPVGFTTRSAGSTALFGPGATGVVADLNDQPGLVRIFAGYAAAFLIVANGPDETAQGVNCVAALREAGVARVVYLSVVKSIPHYPDKVPIERALADWGVPGGILRPNYFDQNDLLSRRPIVEQGVYPMPMGFIGVNRIDCRDIVDVALQRLAARDRVHHDDELHGPEALTGPAVAAVYQDALRKPVRYFADLPEGERGRYVLTSERGRRISAYWEEGRAKATPAAVAHTRALVGRPLRRFADFAGETAMLWKSGDRAT